MSVRRFLVNLILYKGEWTVIGGAEIGTTQQSCFAILPRKKEDLDKASVNNLAGRLTPAARVIVAAITLMVPSTKPLSTVSRSSPDNAAAGTQKLKIFPVDVSRLSLAKVGGVRNAKCLFRRVQIKQLVKQNEAKLG